MFGKKVEIEVNRTIKSIYTIFDKVAKEMGPMMIFNNDEQARRVWPTAFENSKNRKEDFMLVRLGTVDINTMVIVPESILPEDITPTEVDS